MSRLTHYLQAENPQRYLKSSLWFLSTRVVSLIVSLLSIFYIARTLGPQNFGELNYAMSLVTLFAFFGAIASSTVITRDLVKSPEQRTRILSTAIILMGGGVLLTILCIALATALTPHNQLTLLVIGILCLAQLFTPFQIVQHYFIAHANTKYVSLILLFVHITVSLLKITAMTFDQGVLVLASIMVLEQFLLAILLITLFVRHTGFTLRDWHFDTTYAKTLALDSVPFILITMSIVVSGRIDQVFLKHYFDTTTVGLYSAAVQLTEVWQVFPQLLLATLFPAVVNARTLPTTFYRRLIFIAILFILYSTVIALATVAFAPMIVPLLFGAAFVGSIPILSIYIFSLFGQVLGFLITNMLVAENKRRLQVLAGLLPMLSNVALNLLWIPEYGAIGAAYATVVSYSLLPIVMIGLLLIQRIHTFKS